MKNPALAANSPPRDGAPQVSAAAIGPVPEWRESQRLRLRHQDYRAAAARGRARQSLERAKAHLREARLALEKNDATGARRATQKALGIARVTGAAPPLRGTPIGAEAESTVQEAVALAMYLAETLEDLDRDQGYFGRESAVEKALSQRLKNSA